MGYYDDLLNSKTPYQKGEYLGKTGYITWAAHLRAYSNYAAIYGNHQTAERLAKRGGFGEKELDKFYPEWRNHIIEE